MTPTNLTDEGLRSGIKEIVHIKRLGCVDPIEDLIFSFVQQIRDAAKKEERERCAKLAEDYGNSLIGIIKTSAKSNTPYHLKSQGTAKGAAIGAERIATAIRQMEGGK